jgi:hypothetical protein
MKTLALVLAAAMAVSCGSVKTADTHVGREELYRSGNFDYDEFFEDVNSLQSGSKNAEADEKGARAPLGVALGLGETSVDRMLEALRTKAEELSLSKSRVRFALDGLDDEGHPLAGVAPSVAAKSAAKRPVPKDASRLATALGQTAQSEAQVWEKYAPLPDKGRRLAGRAKELQGSLDEDFNDVPKDKRAQVERELEVAAHVSGEIAETCDKVVVSATRFLKEGREILVTSATVQPAPAAAQDKSKTGSKGKPARANKPKEGRPRRSAPNREPSDAVSPAAGTPPQPIERAPSAPSPADFNP